MRGALGWHRWLRSLRVLVDQLVYASNLNSVKFRKSSTTPEGPSSRLIYSTTEKAESGHACRMTRAAPHRCANRVCRLCVTLPGDPSCDATVYGGFTFFLV